MFASPSVKNSKKRKSQQSFWIKGEDNIGHLVHVAKQNRRRSNNATGDYIQQMTFVFFFTALMILLCGCCIDWNTPLPKNHERKVSQPHSRRRAHPFQIYLSPRNILKIVMCSPRFQDQEEDPKLCSSSLDLAFQDFRCSTDPLGILTVQYNTHRDDIDLKRSESLYLQKFHSIARPWTSKDYVTHFSSSSPIPLTHEGYKQHQSSRRYLRFEAGIKFEGSLSNTVSGMDVGFEVGWALASEQLSDLERKKRRKRLGLRQVNKILAGSIVKKRRLYFLNRLRETSTSASQNTDFDNITTGTSVGLEDKWPSFNFYMLLIPEWVVVIRTTANILMCCCMLYGVKSVIVLCCRKYRHLFIRLQRNHTADIDQISSRGMGDKRKAVISGPQHSEAYKEIKKKKKKKKTASRKSASAEPKDPLLASNADSAEGRPFNMKVSTDSFSLVSPQQNTVLDSTIGVGDARSAPIPFSNLSRLNPTTSRKTCEVNRHFNKNSDYEERVTSERKFTDSGVRTSKITSSSRSDVGDDSNHASETYSQRDPDKKRRSLVDQRISIEAVNSVTNKGPKQILVQSKTAESRCSKTSPKCTPFIDHVKADSVELKPWQSNTTSVRALAWKSNTQSGNFVAMDTSSDIQLTTKKAADYSYYVAKTPTMEQREEAYKELKQFQSAQIDKLIQKKQEMQPSDSKEFYDYYGGVNKGIENACSISGDTGDTSTGVASTDESNMLSEDYDFSYLLSGILDIDEDEDMNVGIQSMFIAPPFSSYHKITRDDDGKFVNFEKEDETYPVSTLFQTDFSVLFGNPEKRNLGFSGSSIS